MALLCASLDKTLPQMGWDAAGYNYLKLAVEKVEHDADVGPGLFSGISGLAFAALELSRRGTRYRSLLDSLDSYIHDWTRTLTESIDARRGGIPVHEYDVISGLSGTGAYLLARYQDAQKGESALRGVVSLLVNLTKRGVSGFYTPNGFLQETERRQNPFGTINCGLAHGVVGPLSLLSLSFLKGVRVHGMTQSIRSLANWLISHHSSDQWGINWPYYWSLSRRIRLDSARENHFEEEKLRLSENVKCARAGWCYGSPGVARGLWLAGEATEDVFLQQIALEAIIAVYSRPIKTQDIESPIFCHGVAGLLQITMRFFNDTGRKLFRDEGRLLARRLLLLYEPGSAYGFRDIENGGQRIDDPGLLSGATGIALVLLAASTRVAPGWDRAFLLS